MISRRHAIVGGLSAAVVAAAGTATFSRRGGDPAAPAVGTAQPAPVPPPATGAAAAATQAPSVTAIVAPATVESTADRVDSPLRIDWVGGSDVAWETVSLPDAFLRRVSSVEGRPLDMRTRVRRAVMADGVTALVDEAIAARTDAIIMSINPVWLHWDEIACNAIPVQHERYECLLTPISAGLSERRARELRELIDAAVASGVPLYVYTQPHSADVLANPAVIGRIEAAETAIAGYDPDRRDVRFVARIFTRDMRPLREGVEFIDMVHPTAAGADELGAWLADDVSGFWASIGLGR